MNQTASDALNSVIGNDIEKPKKLLILGSGALKIGEAGEFDYSGSQAIKALKDEGIRSVLVNPNIATIQTSESLADEVYFLPVEPEFVEKVIEREKPDGVFLAFGGQTALNCGLELHDRGILDKHNVRVYGTPLETIRVTEDRELFANKLRENDFLTPRSRAVEAVDDALDVAESIGYPVMVRVAFALGGKGSGIAWNRGELETMARQALSGAPQILVEEYLEGWKEIEYEVVRDAFDNCITVCNMENFDALGIHTGESIVVAPSQTLTDHEYHKLRTISVDLIRLLGVVGECNVQFALHPTSSDYRIIEVNARLSRSSALASKATGYPLAYVAAKLALGRALPDVPNSITQSTTSCFEPALDYVVVKMPRWDLKKFKQVSQILGSEMKSVGEVMAIGRRFEEALQKACRMLGTGAHGVVANSFEVGEIEEVLKNPTEHRLFAIAEAMRDGMDLDRVHDLTKVTPWFLEGVRGIVDVAAELTRFSLEELGEPLMRRAKELGFSDKQIANLIQWSNPPAGGFGPTLAVRERRKAMGVLPITKQIDTLAAEYPAQTNYLYLTYNGTEDDIPPSEERPYAVLGGGAYRIGSSVEFDWCCVNAVQTLQKLGKQTVMINFNPETVSTDYDTCDRLFFEELSLERVLDICDKEQPEGVMISVGGQIPNNLAIPLGEAGLPILGTAVENIDGAENREKFSSLLDDLGIDQPDWMEATSLDEALRFAAEAQYPVLIRPSYVLSGAAMSVAHSDDELAVYLEAATDVSQDHPVVISKFIMNAKEIELDGVARNGEVIAFAISEHVENAGVHSGDATMVFPSQRLYLETMRRVKRIARSIAGALEITGPFNIQFVAKDNHIKVIECNLRASRSFPFVSKILKENFIEVAVRAMLGDEDTKSVASRSALELDYVGVKAPQFSFSRLKGADPLLGVEMASTGEVACLGDNVQEAYLKSLLSVGVTVPKKGVLLSTGTIEGKVAFLESARHLRAMGLPLYATAGTHEFLAQHDIESELLHWPNDETEPNCVTTIQQGKIDLVINVPKSFEKEELSNDYLIRRTAVDYGASLFTNIQAATLFVDALTQLDVDKDLVAKPWSEYV